MQSLLLSRILGHTFWNTNYELRFCKEQWIDKLSFFVGKGASVGVKNPALDSDPKTPHFEQIWMKICISGPCWRWSLAWELCPQKATFWVSFDLQLSFLSEVELGLLSIINVRKLSKSFNDFPRFTWLVRGRTRLSGAWRDPSIVLGAVSWQGISSRVSDMDVLSGMQHN